LFNSNQRCAGAVVQESTPAGVCVFQQKPEQDQEWIYSIGTGPGAGAGVILNHRVFEILMCVFTLYIYTQFVARVKQEQELISFL